MPLLQWAKDGHILLQKDGIQIISRGHCRELSWVEPFQVPDLNGFKWLGVAGLGPCLHKALAYTSQESQRYVMHAILLEPGGEVIGTDGKRLAIYQSPVRFKGKAIMIPGNSFFTLTEIQSLSSLAVTDSRVILQGQDWLLDQPKSEGHFPQWRDVLPKKSYMEIRPDQHLLDVLRSEVAIRNRLKSVLLDFTGEELKFHSDEMSDMTIPWPTQLPIRVEFNPRYLTCVLNEDVQSIRITGENEVVEFRAPGSQVLVMPITQTHNP